MMSFQGLATPSRTALGVAIGRASHQLYDSRPLVLGDPIAVPILGARYRPALEQAAASIHETFSVSMRAWLVARSRLAEDSLAQAVRYGVRQYVFTGSFGLAWYQSDIQVEHSDNGHVRILTILLDDIFGFDPDVRLAATNTFHVGFWFDDPNAAARCGFDPTHPKPFNGEHSRQSHAA